MAVTQTQGESRAMDALGGLRGRRRLWSAIGVVAAVVFILIVERTGLGPISLLEAGLLAMTPLALAAVGECLNEKGGLTNIGLEGIMLIGAVAGAWGAEQYDGGWPGLVVGMLVGALVGLLFGLISVYWRADQVVAGIGINLFAVGIVPYLLVAIWAFPGIHIVPRDLMIRPLYISLGERTVQLSPVTILAVIVAILAHFLLHRTVLGFRIRAAGERPIAADVAGVRVDWLRVFTSTLCGALVGLGGAFMPLAWFGGVTDQISAGRGFIALACVVFAGLEPLLALAAAFIFGVAGGFSYAVAITPGVKEIVPFYFVNMIPYIVTLLIVTLFIGRRRFPGAVGQPYTRE